MQNAEEVSATMAREQMQAIRDVRDQRLWHRIEGVI